MLELNRGLLRRSRFYHWYEGGQSDESLEGTGARFCSPTIVANDWDQAENIGFQPNLRMNCRKRCFLPYLQVGAGYFCSTFLCVLPHRPRPKSCWWLVFQLEISLIFCHELRVPEPLQPTCSNIRSFLKTTLLAATTSTEDGFWTVRGRVVESTRQVFEWSQQAHFAIARRVTHLWGHVKSGVGNQWFLGSRRELYGFSNSLKLTAI